MNRLRNILRGFYFLLTVLLLFYLDRKEGVNLDTITKFKIETLNKVQADSLGNQDKLNLLATETTKFSGKIAADSSRALEVIYYLIGVVCLFILSELIFFTIKKRMLASKNQN